MSFNGMLKSDDVEFIEQISGYGDTISLHSDCKTNIIIFGVGSTYLELPTTAYVGKTISITSVYGTSPVGKGVSSSFLSIQHSKTTLFTLKQGTVSFQYIGQQLNGLTATDKAKSGWIILGGVQGDTAITGYAGSVVFGSGAYAGAAATTVIGQNASATQWSGLSMGINAGGTGIEAVNIGPYSVGNNHYVTVSGSTSNAQSIYGGAFGYQSYSLSSRLSFKSNPRFSIVGDAQAGKFILMRQTTDATPLVMSATNAAASTTNILILPNNGTYAFKGLVVAKDATTLDSAMWEVTALMRRGANASTTVLVGSTITKVFNDAGAAAWTIALTADTTNGGGTITVTGEAAKTIRWVSNIDSAEVM